MIDLSLLNTTSRYFGTIINSIVVQHSKDAEKKSIKEKQNLEIVDAPKIFKVICKKKYFLHSSRTLPASVVFSVVPHLKEVA